MEGDTFQIFQIKMLCNSSLSRIFWQGMQDLEFFKNYSCRLVKQYASRKNLTISSHLCLVQGVPQNLSMGIQTQQWTSWLLSHLFEASLLDKVSNQFISKANKGGVQTSPKAWTIKYCRGGCQYTVVIKTLQDDCEICMWSRQEITKLLR